VAVRGWFFGKAARGDLLPWGDHVFEVTAA
jgi:hypothetical protein